MTLKALFTSFLVLLIYSSFGQLFSEIRAKICSKDVWTLSYTNIDSARTTDTTLRYKFSNDGACVKSTFSNGTWTSENLRWSIREDKYNPFPVLVLSNGYEYYVQFIENPAGKFFRLRKVHKTKGTLRKDYYFNL